MIMFCLFRLFDGITVLKAAPGLWSASRALRGGCLIPTSHTLGIFMLTFSRWVWRALTEYAKYSVKGKRFKIQKGFVLCRFSCNQADQSSKCIFFKCIILRERDHVHPWAGRGRERESQVGSTLSGTVSVEPNVGLGLRNREITTWAKLKSRSLNPWATQVPPQDATQRSHDTLSPNGHCSLRKILPVCSGKSEH